jgi:hypothetical protein
MPPRAPAVAVLRGDIDITVVSLEFERQRQQKIQQFAFMPFYRLRGRKAKLAHV